MNGAFLLLLVGFSVFWVALVSASYRGSESDDETTDSIDWERVPPKTLFKILGQMDDLAESALISEDVQLPHNEAYVALGKSFFSKEKWNLFELFQDKFDYSRLSLAHFWEILLLTIEKEDSRYLKSVLEHQHELIVDNFRTFWYRLMSVDVAFGFDEASRQEIVDRSNCKLVHRAIGFAFEYYVSISEDDSDSSLVKYASFCIFDLLLTDSYSPFPKSYLKGIFKISGLDFNAVREGNCVAIHTLGRTRLPDYYYKMILTDSRTNVNCIVAPSRRKHGHISCQIPSLPLFWHALIYRNYRAMHVLWSNRNLHVMPLIPSFFLLLRLTILFIFFYYFDGRSFRGERRIA